MTKVLFSFIFLVFFSLGAQSQNNKNQATTTEVKRSKILIYQLTQVRDQEHLNDIKSELLKFKHVTNVELTNYLGEEAITLKIFVTEIIRYEGDQEFDQVGVKQLLINKGAKPAKLKIDEINTK